MVSNAELLGSNGVESMRKGAGEEERGRWGKRRLQERGKDKIRILHIDYRADTHAKRMVWKRGVY